MNPLVQVDPGLYIWAIGVFVVLVMLLTKFAWRPLLEALERRQESIRKSLDDARQAQQELEQVRSGVGTRCSSRRGREADGIISHRPATDAARAAEELKAEGPRPMPRTSSGTPSGRSSSRRRAP